LAFPSNAVFTPPLVTAFVELAVGEVSIVVAVAEILPFVSEIAEMYFPAPPTEATSSAPIALVTLSPTFFHRPPFPSEPTSRRVSLLAVTSFVDVGAAIGASCG
jgi:hypothetical protein